MTRLNSRLEAEGAEFLVLGALLIEGIAAYKTYARMPGYDLVAVNPEKGLSVRVQVKSRWASDFDGGFLVGNFDCDFVVFVALNRGYRYGKAKGASTPGHGKKPPEYFVFPVNVVRAAIYEKSKWGKALLRSIPELESFRDNWGLIKDHLAFSLAEPLESAS
ncbi:hypothetical protein EZH22_03845 [Xanthobacter dioxanivorans]|uniref:Uncharacterized protein n=1 Tax=Xanthobacter dioxanivorans TaxID=2528964 RepID=A0A974SIM5_9HYPH|nr:hypothetical protein [Xanthobacter dioxanivorans]QRG07541.1 hypothetical protein EZH22_03845 [Xanthobacter dioxanivorans]